MPRNEPDPGVFKDLPLWDLSDLYESSIDPQLELDKIEILERSNLLAVKHRDATLEPTPDRLREALDEREILEAMRMRVNAFCVLSWTVDTRDPVLGKLDSDNDAFQAEIVQNLNVFDQRFAASAAGLEPFLTDPALLKYRHFLQRLFAARLHQLPEREEALVGKLSLSGALGWLRFYQEHAERWQYVLNGKKLSIQEVLEVLSGQDRDLRAQASRAAHKTLAENAHTTTFVYNMLLLDKATKDEARGYTSWLSERTLKNETGEDEVAALVEAVTGRYDLVSRYFRLYREVFGYETLYNYDIYQELPLLDQPLSWDEARTTVLEALAAFSLKLAEIAELFFENRWIDASPAEGKLGGAYCSSVTSTVHPYIFLNFTRQAGDLFMLAHEMGHGLHCYLAREQGQLQYEAADTLQELAAMFCEMLVFHYLLEREADPVRRYALRMRKLQSVMNGVFQQISFHVFEGEIHTARREEGELTPERVTKAWSDARGAMYGDSVTLSEAYSLSWGWVPHFLEVPGYVHTYAYAELLAWTLYATFKREPEGFAERYLELLRAGASRSPKEVLALFGIDLTQAETWQRGLSLIEAFIDDTEKDEGHRVR